MFDHSITRIALLITITRIRPSKSFWNYTPPINGYQTILSFFSFHSPNGSIEDGEKMPFGEGDKEHNNGNSCATTYLGRVSRRVSFSFSKWSKVFAESRFPRDELWALAPDDEHPFRLFLSLVVSMRNTQRVVNISVNLFNFLARFRIWLLRNLENFMGRVVWSR